MIWIVSNNIFTLLSHVGWRLTYFFQLDKQKHFVALHNSLYKSYPSVISWHVWHPSRDRESCFGQFDKILLASALNLQVKYNVHIFNFPSRKP